MRVLVTGASGLVGSEAVRFFCARGDEVVGVDNNMRRLFFGEAGDTSATMTKLCLETDPKRFRPVHVDIRDEGAMQVLVKHARPDVVIHAAAQPSHDLAARIPMVDFDVNARATLVLLQALRGSAPEAVFCLLSTNKVYGDAPNRVPVVETPTRFRYRDVGADIDETCPIDQSMHSLFGVSKTAADLLTQEYGRYFGMRTGVFRLGCITGGAHAGVELHGFLSHLVRTWRRGDPYTVYGYGGKQVRDQIHARDVVCALACFAADPKPGEVYNLGGGMANSISVLEAIARVRRLGPFDVQFDPTVRKGDHRCYVTNTSKFRRDYPAWSIETDLDAIFADLGVPVCAEAA